jgi:hypothetical protein
MKIQDAIHAAGKVTLFTALFGAAACGTEETEAPAPPAKGTVTLSYSVSSGVKSNPNLVDPLKGAVYGALYLAEDVTVAGPLAEAEDVASVEVPSVDVQMAAESAEAWTSPPLAPGRYTFLGMFDVDGNGAEARDPDPGDPVTLPTTNQFDIVSDKETELTVVFDLVYN